MEKILMYITSHYIYFVIAAGVLIISTIGYVVGEKNQELRRAKDIPVDDDTIKKQIEKDNKQK